MNIRESVIEAAEAFAQELGLEEVKYREEEIADKPFLKFLVGRNAPIYLYALQQVQSKISPNNQYKGRIDVEVMKVVPPFLESMESAILDGLIARSSRKISEGDSSGAYGGIKIVPFHNREENRILQPANHLVLGRRGVGKSTLFAMGIETLRRRKNLCIVIDLQAYELRSDGRVILDIYSEICDQIVVFQGKSDRFDSKKFSLLSDKIKIGKIEINEIILEFKRCLKELTTKVQSDLYLFLDDFHLIDQALQAKLLSDLHGSLKGARGWLKVAGLSNLVKFYDSGSRRGLQVPGDAQVISLDLTLTDPGAAETHLRAILKNYLNAVGLSDLPSIISDAPFRRLVWANAGVVRDFLQMFALSMGNARKARRKKVVLSDVNVSIGELGKQKMSDLEQDSRNYQGSLRQSLERVEDFCLNTSKVNAFLVRQKKSDALSLIQILSDLRIVHLVHQSITPNTAGERYEAYMLDYSLFTGFRRKRNIKEIHPKRGLHFQVRELRNLPVLSIGQVGV